MREQLLFFWGGSVEQIDVIQSGKMVLSSRNPQDITKFLNLVVSGNQDEVESLLQIKPELALMSGRVTDLSNRTFEGITALQYAVWALDWQMWTMIIRFMSRTDISNQINAIDNCSWARYHGIFVSWQDLMNSFQKVMILCEQSRWAEATLCWQKEVGRAQAMLPVHVVNEYCHPERPFEPCPDFISGNRLPRLRQTNIGEWFTARYNNGGLGDTFAYLRYTFREVHCGSGEVLIGVWWGEGEVASSEFNACNTLFSVRKQHRDAFISEFRKKW